MAAMLAIAALAALPGGGGALAGSSGAQATVRITAAGRTAEWMDALISSPAEAQAAERGVLAANDARFIAVFVDLLRASQYGAVRTLDQASIVRALSALSGKRFGDDWPAWREWYRTTALTAPPGYTAWKGRLFARFDPGLHEFFTDAAPVRIRVAEVAWAGVPVDGIAALMHPKTIPATSADALNPSEPVFGLAINGYARAYPLGVLRTHELVNDRVGRVPVVVTYCALSGAGAAYDGEAPDGMDYTFGSSGLLYRSSKLMYDKETRTLWNEFTGEPVIGPLAKGKVRLTLRPMVLTSWRAWVAEHPETKVLDPRAGYERAYVRAAADYPLPSPSSPLWHGAPILAPNAPVFALRIGGVPKAFPLNALAARRVVNDTVAGLPVVLVAEPEAGAAVARQGTGSPGAGPSLLISRAEAGEVRAFARGTEEFRPGPDRDSLLDAAGQTWWITEDRLVGPGGAGGPRLPGVLAHWFAWYEFFPQTLLYRP